MPAVAEATGSDEIAMASALVFGTMGGPSGRSPSHVMRSVDGPSGGAKRIINVEKLKVLFGLKPSPSEVELEGLELAEKQNTMNGTVFIVTEKYTITWVTTSGQKIQKLAISIKDPFRGGI